MDADQGGVEHQVLVVSVLDQLGEDLLPDAGLGPAREAGMSLDDVATILGWSKGKVEQIAARYVTAEQIGLAMVEKLRPNKPKTKAVKGGVKDASASGARAPNN